MYYGKYVFYMLTSIINITPTAIAKGANNWIELSDFGVNKA